ncbi:molybdenum-pterin binding domain protein [Burkholderiales bacterium JOSHI_001]|nr:molybdenum-pterin binding domain protein [Burkholderiales bacterium JOSHI_001]
MQAPEAPSHRDPSLLDGALVLGRRLDARFFALLAAVQATGSLRKAARAAGYSYKGAWALLEAATRWAREPLVVSATGGSGGGGTRVTVAAQQLLQGWDQLQRRHHAFLNQQEAWLLSQPALAQLLRRSAMKTTARNQFAGTLSEVEIGPVTAQATLSAPGGIEITASMTAAAARKLDLKAGQDAIALVKASAVVLVTDFAGYALSARNQLAGTISRIDKGQVSSMVGLTLPGGMVVSASVTNEAVASLGLAVGQNATAVFKACAVMLAVARA